MAGFQPTFILTSCVTWGKSVNTYLGLSFLTFCYSSSHIDEANHRKWVSRYEPTIPNTQKMHRRRAERNDPIVHKVNQCSGFNSVPPNSCSPRTSECDFIWELGLCRVVKTRIKMRRYWIRVGPKSNDWCHWRLTGHTGTQRYR